MLAHEEPKIRVKLRSFTDTSKMMFWLVILLWSSTKWLQGKIIPTLYLLMQKYAKLGN